MSSLAVLQPEVDASIFEEIGEVLTFGSESTRGIFNRNYREIEYPSGYVVGLAISFDCQWQAWLANLAEGDEVSIAGADAAGLDVSLGSYRFIRRIPPNGDESGLVILELGSLG